MLLAGEAVPDADRGRDRRQAPAQDIFAAGHRCQADARHLRPASRGVGGGVWHLVESRHGARDRRHAIRDSAMCLTPIPCGRLGIGVRHRPGISSLPAIVVRPMPDTFGRRPAFSSSSASDEVRWPVSRGVGGGVRHLVELRHGARDRRHAIRDSAMCLTPIVGGIGVRHRLESRLPLQQSVRTPRDPRRCQTPPAPARRATTPGKRVRHAVSPRRHHIPLHFTFLHTTF